MCQCRLNTSDSCPAGKFGVRVRTERVMDQVVVNEKGQALSSSLECACLTERRKQRMNEIERQEE